MKQKYLWLSVTADEYELPLSVRDSAKELARVYGLSKEAVKSAVRREQDGSVRGRKFVKVRIDDGEDI